MKTLVKANPEESANAEVDGYLMMLRYRIEAAMRTALTEALVSGGADIITAQRMARQLAIPASDAVMGEVCTVSTKLTLCPNNVPPELRNGTTQEIIDAVARPKMAIKLADGMLASGLAATSLVIPQSGSLNVVFAGYAAVLRGPDGPMSDVRHARVKTDRDVVVHGPRALGRDVGEA